MTVDQWLAPLKEKLVVQSPVDIECKFRGLLVKMTGFSHLLLVWRVTHLYRFSSLLATVFDVTTDEYQNNVTASEVRNVQQKDTLSNDDNSKFAPKDEQIKAQYTVEDFPQNLTLLNLNQESYRTELEVSGVDQIRNKKLSNVHDLDLVTKNSSQVTTANGNTTLGIVSETAITEPIKPSHQEITRTEFFDQTTSPTLNDEASQTSTTSLTTLKDSADYSSSKGGATFEKMAVEATGTETPSLGIGSFAHRLTPVFH